jgi:MoaA/NifB/PqqE/SkfB family radical SAM enzyme
MTEIPASALDASAALPPPECLFLSLPASDVCNYRCRHCHIWMQSRRPSPISSERRVELVREFAAWNPRGTVIFPGGEVTLDAAELFGLLEACEGLGLPAILLTNGSSVRTDEAAAELATSGATHIVVSLDSHRPELHEYTRGVPGAFETTVNSIRRLAAARDRFRPGLTLIAAIVLFKENLAEFPEYVEFCRDLGVSRVDFQILAHTFANASRGRDVFFERHFWHSRPEKDFARQQFRSLVARYANDDFVNKGVADLDWVLSYVEDPEFESTSPVCGSHYRNLLIDAEGNAALCFNSAAILEAPFVGNVAQRSLAELWSGATASSHRRVMDACTLNCGALNCHRRREPPVALPSATRRGPDRGAE